MSSPNSSLRPDYFEDVYANVDDPWSFATSPYERAKYVETLAALPRARYQSAFEVGCSVGVLTSELAARCDAILSVDVAERPLRQARQPRPARGPVRAHGGPARVSRREI